VEQEPQLRTWIVVLGAKAGFRFDEDQQITIVAGPDSTRGITGVRLRNEICLATRETGPGAPTFVGGFVAEAAGQFSSSEEAFATLGNLASPYFQVMSVISNAGVEESEDRFAYAPPADARDEGRFIMQRHSQARAPAARLRKLAAADAMSAIDLLMGHPREERLQRAMAHYRQALNQLDPQNRVLSAESLWMAVENMTRVVHDRLCREHAINPEADDAKHQLALVLGHEPRRLEARSPAVQKLIDSGELDPKSLKRDNSHLDALDTYIRRDILLGGDKACYKQLREMSDGFEHGYMSFGDVQEKSKVADLAFTHLRRAILKEVGLPDDSPLFDERFDGPQGIWRPILQAEGTYSDSSGRSVSLTPETFNEPWPDPPRLSLVPTMKAVEDHRDGTRTLTLEANGTTHALPATQTASVTVTQWVSPGAVDAKPLKQISTVRLNGEVVSEQVVIPDDVA
jgi:hypothetical protein